MQKINNAKINNAKVNNAEKNANNKKHKFSKKWVRHQYITETHFAQCINLQKQKQNALKQ